MNISNDVFIRTTQDEHKKAVQHLWNVMTEKGYIYLGTYEGWYSVRDECFYSESELIDGKAPTGAEVEWVAKEPSYFFKLSAFQDRLLEYFDQHPDFIAPSTRKNEVVSFVKTGLRDLSISRTSFQWGVPVPGDANHVMYVWIDALTNYISALGYPQHDGNMSKFWPASLHVVGKDILRFHAVYWPAMLMAADLPVPKRLFAHGWWTKDGEKISKSLGNVIDPVDLVNEVSCCRSFWQWVAGAARSHTFDAFILSLELIRLVSFSLPKLASAMTVITLKRPSYNASMSIWPTSWAISVSAPFPWCTRTAINRFPSQASSQRKMRRF